MENQTSITSAYRRLIQILDDPESRTTILATPKSEMTQQQVDTLVALARHFGPLVWNDGFLGDGDADDNGDENENPAKRRRKGTGGATPRHPFRPVMRLKEVYLDPFIAKHIRDHDNDPAAFLNDGEVLKFQAASLDPEKIADIFVSCYKFTKDLKVRIAKDHYRWLFTMLLFFDLFRLIKPDGTGRVGHLMRQDVQTIFGDVLRQAHIPEDKGIEELNEWSLAGSRLNLLCDGFGCGSLFYLGDVLSKDFINKKFTKRGVPHDQAFGHLAKLRLQEKAKESGATALGTALRRYMIKPFKGALRAQRKLASVE